MRVADRVLEPFTPHDPTALPWSTQVHLLLESLSTAEKWDEVGITWDDPRVLWDQPNLLGEMVDVSCDLAGVDIEHGPPDGSDLFPAGSLAATLVDPDGRYSRYNADGTLVIWQIGKRISVVAFDGTEWWWMFHGRITAWNDNGDGTVEVEGFNLPHEMEPIGKFTPGTNGQTPAQRIAAIVPFVTAVGVIQRVDTGDVTLTAQETERSPWEELQVITTMSDGGILFADVDDALVYMDREWRTGRADQERVWILSDTDCTADAVVWNPRLITSDESLSTAVHLENVAGLVAASELAANPYGVAHTLTYTEPGQWTTQIQGDTLADFQLDARSVVLVDIGELTLYVHDPDQDLFPIAKDLRIGDRILFRHDYPGGQFAIVAHVNMIRTSVNPHEWITTIGAWTSIYHPPGQWNSGQWNRSSWVGP